MTDGQLLECFLARDDESAFVALMRRHGGMVLGVCRRVLNNPHDAEDAFQATFLVLIRKAASLLPRPTLGDWLYGVAYHTALKARAASWKRRAKEKQVREMSRGNTLPEDACRDWQPLLDRELSRLPARYREPVVLCDLEGKTRREAARQLAIPEGTLSGRLTTARRKLAKRLTRQGVTLSGGLMAGLLSQKASASVPTALVVATVQAARLVAAGGVLSGGMISAPVAALTEGVLQTMLLTKIKIATMVLLVLGVLGSGAGWLTRLALADKPARTATRDEEKKPSPAAREEGKKTSTEVSGVVARIDAAGPIITLQSKVDPGSRVFKVAKDPRVLLDDGTGDKFGFREGRFSDVTEGCSVTLRLGPDHGVVGIWVYGPTVQAVVKAVDAAHNTITVVIETKGEPATEKTFPVAESARISLDGSGKKKVEARNAKLSDLPAGALVSLTLSADRKVVGSISAQGVSFQGTLKAVDAGKNTLTLGLKEGDKTFEVAKDASVAIDQGKGGKSPLATGKLADLSTGALVTVRLSLDQKVVVAVHAEGAHVGGILKAVDAEKNTITVTVARKGEAPEDHTFTVGKEARIQIDEGKGGTGGKGGTLSDLPVEAQVHVKLSADQKAVIAITAEGPGVFGVVKGTPDKNQLTLADKEGERSFNVGAKTRVLLDDGREGKLSDLIDGTQVWGKLSANKAEIIGTLRAEGPSFHGRVKGVDTTNNTVTLTVGGKGGTGGEDKTFTVSRDTRIVTEMNSVPRKLADLRVEQEVVLRLFVDQKAAARITVLGE
jgi:RNA polymerase sigma factor (sigma-70 family)